jgi:osomolarity two-component system, response regulator SSK1
MQALIDFDGWRKWKDFESDSSKQKKKDSVMSNTNKSTSSLTAKRTKKDLMSPKEKLTAETNPSDTRRSHEHESSTDTPTS